MVRMVATLQQSEQGMIAGKAAADSVPGDKASFAENFARLATTGESVRGADVAGISVGEKTNEDVAKRSFGQQFARVKSQAGLVSSLPAKREDVLPEAENNVDGAVGRNSVMSSSKQVGPGGSATKRSVLNAKVNQAGADVKESNDSSAKSEGIASGKTQVTESVDASGRKSEDNFAADDAGEAGMTTVMSDVAAVAGPGVARDVVALAPVRGDEIVGPKEGGGQGLKADAVMGSKSQRVEAGRSAKSGRSSDSGSAGDVMTGSSSMTGAAVDVTVPMTQQTVTAPLPTQHGGDEVVAGAAGQVQKRGAGVGFDQPITRTERRQDARPGVEQAGVGQSGTAAAGEISAAGRKDVAGEAQTAAVDETGKAALAPAGVEGAKVQELVASDALMVGIKGHGAEHVVEMKQADAAGTALTSSGQEGMAGDAAGISRGGHGTLAATATTLEIGMPGGTHGWLKIRAEMGSGGEVTAALSSSSPSGQAMLRRELPALSSFLQDERLTVHAVVLDKVGTGAGIAGSTQSGSSESAGDGRAQQGRSQQGQWSGQNAQGEASRQGKARGWSFAEESVGYAGWSGAEMLPQAMYGSGGSWLSVRA